MKKDKAIDVVQNMPDKFSLDELIERLIFMDQVEKGLNDIREGNLTAHDEVIKHLPDNRNSA
ncbi:MAG TPA: hypothetical protein VEV16_09100 [Daejeonella sp.]|nr:hypothetical protein [Daejeonella sp.]